MSTGAIIGLSISIAIVAFALGFFIATYITQKKIKKQLDENPPINEKMIRAMFLQMGRKPSEAQIKAVMRSMKNAK